MGRCLTNVALISEKPLSLQMLRVFLSNVGAPAGPPGSELLPLGVGSGTGVRVSCSLKCGAGDKMAKRRTHTSKFSKLAILGKWASEESAKLTGRAGSRVGAATCSSLQAAVTSARGRGEQDSQGSEGTVGAGRGDSGAQCRVGGGRPL